MTEPMEPVPAELVFFKSSFSGPYSDACVEVAYAKATASSPSGNCVEVGKCDCDGGTWHVRDSKNPAGPVLQFNWAEMDAFVQGVKAGEFDMPGVH